MLFPVFVTLFLWIPEWKTTCLRTDAILKQLAAHCGFSYLNNRFLTSDGRRTLRMQKWKHPLLAAECSSHHLPEVIKKLFWVIKEITTWGRRRWGLLWGGGNSGPPSFWKNLLTSGVGRWRADRVCADRSRWREREVDGISERLRGVTVLCRNTESFPAFSFALQEASVTTVQTSPRKCSRDAFQMCVEKLAAGFNATRNAAQKHREHVNEL